MSHLMKNRFMNCLLAVLIAAQMIPAYAEETTVPSPEEEPTQAERLEETDETIQETEETAETTAVPEPSEDSIPAESLAEKGEETDETEEKSSEETAEEDTGTAEEADPDMQREQVPEDAQLIPENDENLYDLDETLVQAAQRLNPKQGRRVFRAMSRKTLLQAHEKTAVYRLDGDADYYISRFQLGERPAYCLEPQVANVLNGDKVEYEPDDGNALSQETRDLCRRYAYAGYGNPLTGNADDAYVATQMLIWQAAAPQYYEKIRNSLKLRNNETVDSGIVFERSPEGIEEWMEDIRFRAENYNTVPSFASAFDSIPDYGVSFQEPLKLKDDNHVLSWFEMPQAEGIECSAEGDTLNVRITSLTYEGYENEQGIPLVFRRKDSAVPDGREPALVYASGSRQKLFAESGIDPVEKFTASFHLKRSDVLIHKQDEYGKPVSGSLFQLSYDRDGKNPVMHGDSPAVFCSDANGDIEIRGLLPAETELFLQETAASGNTMAEPGFSALKTGKEGSEAEWTFTNQLKPVRLDLVKSDKEDGSLLNGASFVLYAVDQGSTSYQPGLTEGTFEEENPFRWEELKERGVLEKGRSFTENGWLYQVVEVNDENAMIQAWKMDDEESFLSRYQLPDELYVLKQFHVSETLNRHGTDDPSDDTVLDHALQITDIDKERQLVHVRETNGAKEQLITQSSSPSLNDLKKASAESGMPLIPGARMKVNGRIWTIEEENSRGIRVSQNNEYTIDLSEAAPCAADVPLNIADGDPLKLSWPTLDGEKNEVLFSTVHTGLAETVLSDNQTEYAVTMPAWISQQDEPEKSIRTDSFSLLKVNEPVYIVKDSFNNRYSITKTEKQMIEDGDGEPAWTSVYGTFQEFDYEDLIGGKPDGSGACLDPFEPEGCPVGLTRSYDYSYEIPADIAVPSYEAISDAADETGLAEIDGVQYQIEEMSEDSLKVRFHSGASLSVAVIPKGAEAKAFHVHSGTVDYTIEKAETTSFDVIWKNRYDKDGKPILNRTAFLSKEQGEAGFPLDYQQIIGLEKERGKGFLPNETFSVDTESDTGVHSSFEVDGRSYALTSNDPHTLLVSLDRNSPISALDVFEGTRTGSRFAVSNGMARVAGQDGRQLIVEDENGKRSIFEYLSNQAGKKETAQFSIARKEELTWRDLETALLRNKKEGDFIRMNDAEYEITALKDDSCTLRKKGSLADKLVIPSTKAEEAGLDMEKVRDAELVLRPGDGIDLKGNHYTLRFMQKNGTGMHARLMDAGRNLIDLYEKETDPVELLLFVRTGEKKPLKDLVQGEKFELRQNDCGAVLEDGMVSSESGGTTVLLCMDKEGNVLSRARIIFSDEEKQMRGIPVFKGETGKAWLHAAGLHSRPYAYETLMLYSDSACTKPLKEIQLDETGTADVSGFAGKNIYWKEPGEENVSSMHVALQEARHGLLDIPDLQEGRTYVLLETGLPEGYEYVQGPYTVFEAHGDDKGVMHLQVENLLRRVSISVVKVDQDEKTIPLDGAWFTAEDVTGMDQDHEEAKRRIRLSDIPGNAAVGDYVSIWRSRPDGRKLLWKIEEVKDDRILLRKEEEGTGGPVYPVMKDGYQPGAVMLYEDIEREADSIQAGVSFSLMEKEDPSFLHTYRIVSVHRAEGKDLFGNPVKDKVINSAVVVDVEDQTAQPVFLDASSNSRMEGSSLLGEFVSGGILVHRSEKKPSLPVSWDSLMDASGGNPAVNEQLETEEGTFTITRVNRSRGKIISVVVKNEEGEWMIPENAVPVYVEVGKPHVQAILMDSSGKQVAIKETDGDGKCLFENLKEDDYIVYCDGITEQIHAGPGIIAVPGVKYGHSIRVCETKSPLGHMIGEACTVFVPHGDSVDTVKNFRTNAKVTTVQKTIVRRVRKRRMGSEE